ncbi:MAG: glycoside hydrolase family 28 protein [Candidatus Pacebacteria bacterium]|nr:glycoside hydrolase family 28 protein [Candidatus Paceibacterota bacterium]MDR3583418.1 glycoside hydrolase family 28 protein [Candidatus Paceibacterota bacterium]
MSSRHHYYLKTIISLLIIAAAAAGLAASFKKDKAVYIQIQESSRPALIPPSPATLALSTPFNNNLKIQETNFPDRICNIKDYGAASGGKTLNTKAITEAVYDCARQGGGKVEVPTGLWLTGSIHLMSNIDLDVAKGATLLFSTDPTDYLPVVFSRFEGIEYYNYSPPIYAQDVQNVALTGQGQINGQGEKYWWAMSSDGAIAQLYSMGEKNVPVDQRVFGVPKNGLRPAFVEFVNCDRILVNGVTLINGPMWTIHPLYSHNVIVKNVNIQTEKGPSTDGVDIDSSKNVLVADSTFTTGDDAISIKSGRDNDGRRVDKPTENVVLKNNFVNNAHGAIAIGSEMSADVRNVLAKNFTIDQAQYGFRVKSNIQRSGTAENIWIEDMNIDSVSQAVIQFNTDYEKGNIKYTLQPPTFQNIHIENVACKNTGAALNFIGITGEDSISNIDLKNVTVTKSRDGLQMNDAQNITLDNVSLAPKYGPTYDIDNSSDITLTNSNCSLSANNFICLSVTGAASKNIQLTGDDFENKIKTIQIGPEVSEDEVKMN